jgi:hypothetical protein
MGFFLEFDEANNVVRLTFDPTVTTEDIAGAAYSALRAFAQTRTAPAGIADFSPVKSIELANGIIQSRARLPPTMPGGKMFVIVAPGDHIFGLSHMFSLHAERSRPHSGSSHHGAGLPTAGSRVAQFSSASKASLPRVWNRRMHRIHPRDEPGQPNDVQDGRSDGNASLLNCPST